MKQSQKAYSQRLEALNSKFPTIGLLTEGLSGDYQAGAWPGIVDAVHENKLNLLCFCGGSLRKSSENPWDHQGNIVYKMAQKHRLDGLIIAGHLGSYVSDDEFNEFLGHYRHLKTVALAPANGSIPAVYVDNRKGMRALVEHMVIHHSYRKIVFIKGPVGNIEAEERFQVFREVLQENAIPVDPQRIQPGDFTRNCGSDAINRLFASGTGFDAVIAATDDTALGAMEALLAHGKRVPEDIGLAGFDDADESGFATPPLTTVNQPLYELGKTTVRTMVRLLSGESIQQNTLVEPRLVVRQSCGCFYRATYTYGIQSDVALAEDTLSPSSVLAHCESSVDGTFGSYPKVVIDCFCAEVNRGTVDLFLKKVDTVWRELLLNGQDPSVLSPLFYKIWQYAFSHLEKSTFARADDLLHSALEMCENLKFREQGMRSIRTVRENGFLHEIGDVLKNTILIENLLDVMCHFFPLLGISTFYFSLYEHGRTRLKNTSILKVALLDGERIGTEKENTLFETSDLFPAQLPLKTGSFIYIIEPLYFQKEQFGILLMEADGRKTEPYGILKEYIGGALHTAALIQKVQEQTKVLARANVELEELREKEHERLETIKHELELGRKIQMGFLPQRLPQIEGWEIAAAFLPAREVSGDFYDSFMLDKDSIALVIADISGKDVSAALFMSLIRTLIHVFAERSQADGEDPLDSIATVNEYLFQHHLQGDGRSTMFATIVFAVLRPSTGELRYINAGHIAPVVIRENSVIKTLTPTGMAVGLAQGCSFRKGKITIESGEMLFCFTDGVTEAKNPQGEFFTSDRLMEILKTGKSSAQELIEWIKSSIVVHNQGAAPYDDITMLAVKRR
jgi:serine phosphatase RsbU (regulator of sigma subunit)/DNA-binding LacI/PurR family transcriptional regulator